MLIVCRKHGLLKSVRRPSELGSAIPPAGFEIGRAVMSPTSCLGIFNNPPGDDRMDSPSFMVIITAHIIHVFISHILNGVQRYRSTNFIQVVPDYTQYMGKYDFRKETETS